MTGWVALSDEMTQHGIAAQQPSEKDAWCDSGFKQHRIAGRAIGVCSIAEPTRKTSTTFPNMLNV